jgi:hypothetical protein
LSILYGRYGAILNTQNALLEIQKFFLEEAVYYKKQSFNRTRPSLYSEGEQTQKTEAAENFPV